MIVILLKLVVEEYIMHIGPFDFPIEAVPFIADEERWNRTNWCAIEFNLLQLIGLGHRQPAHVAQMLLSAERAHS